MFFSPFSDFEYEESKWPIIYIVESVTQTLVHVDPALFVEGTVESVCEQVMQNLRDLGFPSDVEEKVELPTVLHLFFSRELENLREYAAKIARIDNVTQRCHSANISFSPERQERLYTYIKKSASFRAVVREPWWEGWCLDTLKKAERRRKERS